MTDGTTGSNSIDETGGADRPDGTAGAETSGRTDESDAADTAFEGADTETPATADSVEDEEERSGNIAGTLDLEESLEPQDIDLENAIFVAMGVLLVVGFLVVAIQGL
jgi:hypothetical protein